MHINVPKSTQMFYVLQACFLKNDVVSKYHIYLVTIINLL